MENPQLLGKNLQSSKIPPGLTLIPPPQKKAISLVMILQTRTIYRRVADVEPNNLQEIDGKSRQWLWHNLLSSI